MKNDNSSLFPRMIFNEKLTMSQLAIDVAVSLRDAVLSDLKEENERLRAFFQNPYALTDPWSAMTVFAPFVAAVLHDPVVIDLQDENSELRAAVKEKSVLLTGPGGSPIYYAGEVPSLLNGDWWDTESGKKLVETHVGQLVETHVALVRHADEFQPALIESLELHVASVLLGTLGGVSDDDVHTYTNGLCLIFSRESDNDEAVYSVTVCVEWKRDPDAAVGGNGTEEVVFVFPWEETRPIISEMVVDVELIGRISDQGQRVRLILDPIQLMW